MQPLSNEQREQIEKLAYQLWEERGRPFGSPDEDWLRAEREFVQRSDWTSHLPFASLEMDPIEHLRE